MRGDDRGPDAMFSYIRPELCLRLQRGCGVRGWRRDGLGTGVGKGARGRGER